jgi:hypothetical protein
MKRRASIVDFASIEVEHDKQMLARVDRTINRRVRGRTRLSKNNRSKIAAAMRYGSAAIFLVQVLSRPGEQRVELVRVDQKINYERHRS